MKKYILCLMAYAVALFVNAVNPLAQKGDSSYINSEYHLAINNYEEAISQNGSSSELYYNLGNAYYKANNLGKAIVNYEKALKLDASNEDAIFNLNLARTKTLDKILDNRNFITRICDSVVYSMSSNAWAYISLILLVLCISAIICYFYANKIVVRKIGFFGAIFLFVGLFIAITCSVIGAMRIYENNEAIVIEESVMLSTSPRVPLSHAEEALLLHEGAKIIIVDSLLTPNDTTCRLWYEVEVDKNRAWVKSLSVEKI